MEADLYLTFISSISVKLIKLAACLLAATTVSFKRRVCFIFMTASGGGGRYKKMKTKVGDKRNEIRRTAGFKSEATP